MDNLIIRTGTHKDLPLLLSLLYDLGRPKPQTDSDVEDFRNLLKKYLSDSDKTILVAEIDNIEIVGLASIMFLPRLNRTSLEMYIPELVVIEKHQNHGIGKRLIDFCIALAKKQNCHRIRLESGNQRGASHAFYKHLGFEQSSLSFTLNFDL